MKKQVNSLLIRNNVNQVKLLILLLTLILFVLSGGAPSAPGGLGL